jgi:serine/threonine protein kinase
VKQIVRGRAEVPEALARFRREARLGARVRARCVAQVLDFQVNEEPVWLASEFIAGPTLRERLDASGPLTVPQVRAFALGVAEALAAIHAEGIAHRDLTFNNVILAADGPRVIDFGIARAVDGTNVTSTGGVVGTPNWISPERWDGERGGPSADVFAWAVTVLAAATGAPPFSGGDALQVRHRILHEVPDLGGLPDSLAGSLAEALAQDPDDRPSAAQLCLGLIGWESDPDPATLTQATGSVLDEEWSLQDVGHGHDLPEEPVRAAGSPRAPRSTPPFTFQGSRYRSVAGLAEEMSGEWQAAATLFGDAEERRLLASWVFDDLDDPDIDRAILRRKPKDPHLAAAEFIAEARPDLPPSFKGIETTPESLTDLTERYLRNPQRAAEDFKDLVDSDIQAVISVAARHHCTGRHTGCSGEEGCSWYTAVLAEMPKVVEVARAAEEEVNGALGRALTSPPGRSLKAPQVDFHSLALLLHPDLGPGKDTAAALPQQREWHQAMAPVLDRAVQRRAEGRVAQAARAVAGERLAHRAAALATLETERRKELASRKQRVEDSLRHNRKVRQRRILRVVVSLVVLAAIAVGCTVSLQEGDPRWTMLLIGLFFIALFLFSRRNSFRFPATGEMESVDRDKQDIQRNESRIAELQRAKQALSAGQV